MLIDISVILQSVAICSLALAIRVLRKRIEELEGNPEKSRSGLYEQDVRRLIKKELDAREENF